MSPRRAPSDAELDAAAGALATARAALQSATKRRAQLYAVLDALETLAITAAERLALALVRGMLERELGRRGG